MHHRPALVLKLACWIGAVSGSGDHGGTEYLALYSMEVGGSYTLRLDAVGEEDSVEFMVVPSSSADLEGLEVAEEESTPAWEEFLSGSEAPTSITGSSSAIPSRSVVYTVSLIAGDSSLSSASLASSTAAAAAENEEATVVVVPLAIADAGAYTLLLNHGEIPASMMSPAGEALAPLVSEDGHEHHHEDEDEEDVEEEGNEETGVATARQWANALGASFLISLCSFVGIVTIVSNRITQKINLSLALLFASGALLTTAVVHIIPEALEELAHEYPDDLHGVFLRSGATVMAGILVGFLLHVALDNGSGHSHSAEQLQLLPVAGRGSDGTPGGATKGRTPTKNDDSVRGNGNHGKGAASFGEHAFENGGGHTRNAGEVAVKPLSSEGTNFNIERVSGGDQTVGSISRGGSGQETVMAAEDPRACDRVAETEEGRRQEARPSDTVEAPMSGGKRDIDARLHCVRTDRIGGVAAGVLVKSSLHDGKRAGVDRRLFDIAGLDPVCWNVIVGDFAHNFSDGVTMAAAFLGCSSTVGWTITAANMMHEIPHELGNFMALVNGGMSTKQALLYNFFSALFAVFGVLLTFSLRDLISSTLISYLLLVGAGTFIFVGLSEIVPDAVRFAAAAPASRERVDAGADRRAKRHLHRRAQTRKALAFTVGTVLLGLPLLFHKHCDANGDHGGHDHR